MTQRYDTYKDSGIQWLGEIPGHWGGTAMGRIISSPLQYGASESGDPTEHPGDWRYIRITDITLDGKLKNEGQKYLPKDIAELYPLKKGDLLFARSGATVGKSYLFKESINACFAGYLIKARINKDIALPEYISHFTKSTQYDEWKNRIFIQATIQNIGADKYNRLYVPLPPLPEQHAIVSYLDDKCGKIDEWIEKKQKEVELLQEMKQRVIADAVTRGLPSLRQSQGKLGSGQAHVKMKPTNIPWLPEVPEHWEVKTLRNFLSMFVEKGHGEKQLLSVTREQGVIVRNTESKEENHNFIPEDLSNYKYVQEGDFVINKMKSWQGSYGVSEHEGIVSPAYFTCKLSGVDKSFFSTAIRSKVYVSFFGRYSKGIRVDQWDLSPIALKSIPFILPPLSEQRAIVSYINERTAKIDKMVENVNREIENLKEYKQRLISDVVTGQIKVINNN